VASPSLPASYRQLVQSPVGGWYRLGIQPPVSDDVWKLNKHLDGDINTIRLLLIDVKITLPEGDEDDTFLLHSDQD
jgi:hypothetical protein